MVQAVLTPIKTDRYAWLSAHPQCDCIADVKKEPRTHKVYILAYAETHMDNAALSQYFVSQHFSKHIRYMVNTFSDADGDV